MQRKSVWWAIGPVSAVAPTAAGAHDAVETGADRCRLGRDIVSRVRSVCR